MPQQLGELWRQDLDARDQLLEQRWDEEFQKAKDEWHQQMVEPLNQRIEGMDRGLSTLDKGLSKFATKLK